MNRRLFIAIDLPAEIKTVIRETLQTDKTAYAELYRDARMTPEKDWHMTLLFLGEYPEQAIEAIGHSISDVISKISSPKIAMRILSTAPPHRPPRMIWVTTSAESNEILGAIKESILQDLALHAVRPQGARFETFNGHITLARLPEGRKIADHTIAFAHEISFTPKTVDLMESRLESTGAAYTVLKSIDFKPSI